MFTVTDLGTIPGYVSSEALAVNANNEVVGACAHTHYPEWKPRRAFHWHKGKMADLQTLGGADSVAYAVNDHGTAVGASDTATGERHAFMWTKNGGMVDLGLGEKFSAAFGINNKGTICGRFGPTYGIGAVGFIRWASGNVQEVLGSLAEGPSSGAVAINENDQVAGWQDIGGGGWQATVGGLNKVLFYPEGFLWAIGIQQDLGLSLDGTGAGINKVGRIAGSHWVSSGAFEWAGGTYKLLDSLPGYSSFFARDINDSNVVVGAVFDDLLPQTAVMWHGFKPIDLNAWNSSPWIRLDTANSISNHGSIVGRALVSGSYHAFLADPNPLLVLPDDFGMQNGLWIHIVAGAKAGGSGIGITTGGRVIPIPGPDPILLELEAALATIPDVQLRLAVRGRIAAAVSREIQAELEALKGGH